MSQYTDVVQIDLTDVREFSGEGGPQLAPGEYVFEVASAEQGTSQSNNPTWKVTFVVADGPNQGAKLTNTYSLQPQALGRVKKCALAIGATLTRLDASEWVGSQFRGVVVHEQGQTKMGPDGNALPPRMYAKLVNELPLEQAQAEAPPPPPPITRKVAGAVRRA
jgi:hypothetical protein